ncbi:membrane protein [Novosphingobium endophyticum]|uniref:Membrane protein n=1 Tax=Novosphingobium endophyticum TaxID=1955250 RepID=A0A916TSQ2_9SPHN|nr:MAPEG family protein [Novosphingobium endophyticum]GGC01924.1 membrane protein [Novosphingobium endophyticum]
MIGMAILQPVVALAAWTMVMWFWLYGTRIPALSAAKVDPEELVSDPTVSLDNVLPPQVQWKAHNYNHLHEAPTVFYAVAITLAIIGQGDGLNAQVGWAYVGLRVIHSIIQSTINKVTVRFGIFALSSFCLMFLVARAALAMF